MRISDWSSDVCSSDLPNDRSGVLAAAVDDAAKAASTAILFHFTRPDTLSLMICRPPSLPGFARLPLLTLMHAARTCLVHDVAASRQTAFHQSACTNPYVLARFGLDGAVVPVPQTCEDPPDRRSEEHTSELQSLMRISYSVFCL